MFKVKLWVISSLFFYWLDEWFILFFDMRILFIFFYVKNMQAHLLPYLVLEGRTWYHKPLSIELAVLVYGCCCRRRKRWTSCQTCNSKTSKKLLNNLLVRCTHKIALYLLVKILILVCTYYCLYIFLNIVVNKGNCNKKYSISFRV